MALMALQESNVANAAALDSIQGVGLADGTISLLPQPDVHAKERRKCSMLATSAIAGASLVLGTVSGAGLMFVAMQQLASQGRAPVPLPRCTGACDNRLLSGRFVANVSRSENVLGIPLWVRFVMEHYFNGTNGTANIAMYPIQSPFNELQPFYCADVPFTLGLDCNVTLSDVCTESAFRASKVRDLNYLWDGADRLTVSQVMDPNPLFRQQLIWEERRVAPDQNLSGVVEEDELSSVMYD